MLRITVYKDFGFLYSLSVTNRFYQREHIQPLMNVINMFIPTPMFMYCDKQTTAKTVDGPYNNI